MSTLALEPRAAYDITSPLSPVDRMAAGFLAGFDGATLHAYTDDLMHYFDWCRLEVHLDPMTAERPHLELYVRWMQRHPNRWAEQTIARRIGTVCSMYHIAKRDRLITENPGEFVKRPKVDREKQHRTVLSVLELAKLMQHVFTHGTPTDRAYLALLGYRGLRVSEACGLDVTDYYEERGYRMIRFVGKGSKARVVSIPPPAQAHIEAAIAGRESGPILLNQWGNRMTRQNGCVLAKRLATDAGLMPQVAASIANHTFRRTFITTGRQMGIPLDDLSKTVGHANLTTTQIYDRRDDRFRDKSYEIAGHLAQLAS